MNVEQVRGISNKAKQEKWKFPLKFIALKDAGVNSYRFDIITGRSVYEGTDGSSFSESHQGLEPEIVNDSFNSELISAAIQRLTAEKTNFDGFCKEAAFAGVSYWNVEMNKGICTYYGKDGRQHVENVPV